MPIRPIAVAVLFATLAGSAAAQEPPAESKPPVTAVETLTAEPRLPAERAVGQQHAFAVSLILLQPSVGRVQVKVWDRPNGSVWLEAYGGSVLFEGMYGFGVRQQFTGRRLGETDAIMIAPGLGVHIVPHDEYTYHSRSSYGWGAWGGASTYTQETGYFLAGDVDVSWLHDFHPRFGFELGVKAGLAGRVGGRFKADGRWQRGVMFGDSVYPIFSIYSGLRF